MNQSEWLTCQDPQPMLEFLRGKASDRKLRLFAVACCRRVLHLMTDERSVRVAPIAEQHADCRISDRMLFGVRIEAAAVAEEHRNWVTASLEALGDDHIGHEVDSLGIATADTAWFTAARDTHLHFSELVARRAADALAFSTIANIEQTERCKAVSDLARADEHSVQSFLLRCILNPFYPVTLCASYLTPTVTALANDIYTSRDFERLPILADALEEAGCSSQELLEHLRSVGPHVRGCFALDLVLGKS